MGLSSHRSRTNRAFRPLIGVVILTCATLCACGDDASSPDPSPDWKWGADAFKAIPLPKLDFGDDVTPAATPKRVVSTIPSVTELVFALGLGGCLVGRSHWCDWPPEALALPDVGRLQAMSKETIVDLRPDLVFMERTQVDLARSLRRDFGIRVVSPPGEAWDEIYAGMKEVATALGVPERGDKLVAHLKRSLTRVRTRWSSRQQPRVLVVLDRSSWWVPGRTSFVHEILKIAGGENVAASLETDKPWPTVTFERIVDWEPSVILDLSIGTDAQRSQEAAARFWKAHAYIPAVRAGRVFLGEAGVLVRPGPRMAAVAARLAEIIHDGP